jgi:acyl-CoA synthetase (AMP-forming)/AMP-acid ligase II
MYPGSHASADPERPAFIMATSGQVVTFGELEVGANRLANYLRQVGLRRGDHVAFFMENHPALLECEAAAERTGLYYTCVNSYLSTEEIAYIVSDCQARVVVTSAAKAAVAYGLPAGCPAVEHWLIVGVDDPPAPYECYEARVGALPGTPVPDEQLGAAMLYSSGTTGRPKGILRPLPDAHPSTALPVMEFVKGMFRMREDMVYLSPAPLYHSAPQASVALAVRLGCTSVIMEHFDAAQFLDLVGQHRVTHSQLVPTMFTRLLRLPEDTRARADVSSLEVVIHAAAPCPVAIKEKMIGWLGPILIEYYGATEGNGFTWCDSTEWLSHKGTVGRAILGEILILDDSGTACPPGAPGTVWFRGATNFEYFNDPAKTAESRDATGTASTVGDVGRLEEDGYLYLTDRASFMIVSGGVNIYPQETENLLVTHPKVMDAAVIGVPNEDLGEEVKAVIQPAPGVEGSPDLECELIDFCSEHLARFKCPRSVDFVEQLPRLPTGKLYKRLLRDEYWQGHSTRIL